MNKIISKLNTKVIFIGIIVLSFILRFYLLGINPPSLDWDEASIGYNAYSILKTGKDEYGNLMPISFRSFDDYKPPVYIYLTVPSVAIFGLNEFAVRFPAAIFGVLAVIVVYYLAREILSSWDIKRREWVALASAFFLCISPWHLQFSRAAFEGNMGMFFLIFSLFLFFRAFKKPLLYIPFSLFLVLSMYSYHSFRLIGPFIIFVLLVLFFKQLIKQKFIFIFSLFLILLLSLPIYVSLLKPQGTGARLSMVTIFSDSELLKVSAEKLVDAKKNNDIVNQILYNRRVIFIPRMIQGYTDHFNFSFLFLKGDGGVQHHAYNMGMLYLWDLPFILLGIYFLARKLDRRVLFLIILFFMGPLPASITTGTPQPIRAIAMIPGFQIFTAVGLVGILAVLSNKKKLRNTLLVLGAILLIINVSYYLYSYYILSPVKYGYFWQYGNKEAVIEARKKENNYSRIIMSYQYDQPYIYYLFYNKIDPTWYQGSWNYSGTGELDRFYRKIGKYEFRNINYAKDKQIKNALLVGTPKEINDDKIIGQIKYLDGSVAYKFVGTE